MGTPEEELVSLLEQLQIRVEDELKCVSYKWIARNYRLPADAAKKVLFSFYEKNRGSVRASFIVSGWVEVNESVRKHVVRLVDSGKLQAELTHFAPKPSLHLYSVQPAAPQDSATLYNEDREQTEKQFEEFLQLTKSSECQLYTEAACSAVRCVEVQWSGVGKARVPLGPITNPAQPPPAAAHMRGPGSLPAPPPPAGPPVPAASAPAQAEATHLPAKGSVGGRSLQGLWQRAAAAGRPLASEAPPPAAPLTDSPPSPAPLPAPGPAPSAADGGSDSEDSQDGALLAQRRGKRGAGLVVEDEESPQAGSKVQRRMTEGKGDKGGGKGRPKKDKGAGEAQAGKEAGQQSAEAGGGVAHVELGAVPLPEPRRGTVKHTLQSGAESKRRKVVRSTYNDKGEEETLIEWVEEGEGVAGGVVAAPTAALTPSAEPLHPQTRPDSEVQQQAGVKDKSSLGGKKGSKGKTSAGQRNIMSFFAKK